MFDFIIQKSPLFVAIEQNNIEIVKLLLLDSSINPNLPYVFYH